MLQIKKNQPILLVVEQEEEEDFLMMIVASIFNLEIGKEFRAYYLFFATQV